MLLLFTIVTILYSCNTNKSNAEVRDPSQNQTSLYTLTKHPTPLAPDLPTIGLLMYNGVLQNEVVAASDVFSKSDEDGQRVFNVITVAKSQGPVTTEEGLQLIPDYTFENCPKLEALFVPSAYDMYAQVHDNETINFIKRKNDETEYTVSNCAGARLIGESGIARGHKIVTWIGGGDQLQKDYPTLDVQNDSVVTYVKDGKFLSSNGNLASYISALELLEIMAGPEHRKFVESYLYLDRLQNWSK